MQSLVSLDGYSAEIKSYLTDHQWPALVEALLSGVAVMLPEDPWEFMQQSLLSVRSNNSFEIQWDMFIDPSVRPCLPPLHRRVPMDEEDLPAQEVLEKVHTFRRNKLYRLCFKAWLLFHKLEVKEREEFRAKCRQASIHYNTKILLSIIRNWQAVACDHCYSVKKSRRRAIAVQKLTLMFQKHVKKSCFQSWLDDTRECKKARMFFQNRGKGEGGEGDTDVWYYPEGEDPISLFPRDVCIKIFKEIGIQGVCRCAQVCRSWREITEDTRLWSKIDVSPLQTFLTDGSLTQILTKFRPLLCHINLRGCTLLTPDSFRYIAQCQNLQDLNLSECQGITDDVFKNIGSGCSGLFYLNLSYCFVTDSLIRILTRHCVSLNYLSLAYCLQFTSKGLQSIISSKGCRKLIHLDLSGCVQLNQEAFHYIGQGCPILQTLLLNDMSTITDEAIISLSAHCHSLRHFSVMGGSSISDIAIKHLALGNKKLRSIRIDNNDIISDQSMRVLAKSCRDIQVLCLPGCSHISDQGLKALGHLKKLHVLNIADCTRVSDAGIRYVVENSSGAHIRELNLTNCAKLSDVSPLRISQHCHNLKHLNLCFCEHISDTGVELVSQIPTLIDLDITGCDLTDQGVSALHQNSNLRHVSIAELPGVTDDGIAKMAKGLNNLETVDLSGCEVITDVGIQILSFNCQLLRVIKLANCPAIKDNSAKYISQGCAFVEVVDLSGTRITDQSLRHLRKGCQHLKQVDVLSCVNVTKEAVMKLQKHCSVINYSTDPPQYNSEGQGGGDDMITVLPAGETFPNR